MDWSTLPRVRRVDGCDAARFRDEIQAAGKPVLLPGLVSDWPAVAAGRESDSAVRDYLRAFDSGVEAEACFGHAGMAGRYFYDAEVSGFNFERRSVTVSALLDFLLQVEQSPQTLYGYAGAVRLRESLPGFLEQHPAPLLDPSVEQLNSIWIGNRSRISAHWDLPQNLICAVSGRRRYVLFPPEQLPNLYCGPLEFTPAGQPISLVDFEAPDLARFPRFAEAWRHAQLAELDAGDVLYLPSLWWHHAQSLDALGVMVNFWWREQPAHALSPKQTLLHALMTVRDLPPHERAAWRAFFDHYVFRPGGDDPAAHIAPAARGVLGEMTPELAARLRAQLLRTLQW